MTLDVSLTSPTMASQPPVLKADMRPTADVAALVRDPQPDLPLPIPASNGQNAAVAQSSVARKPELAEIEAVDPTQRVLKPYGVSMLPNLPDPAEAPKEETPQEVETKDAERAEAAISEKPETPVQTPPETVPEPVETAQEVEKPAPETQEQPQNAT